MNISPLKTALVFMELALFCLFHNPISAQTPTAFITTWKDSSKAAFSIIHDDYSDYVTGIFQYAHPLAKARGIKLCFGAITSACGPTEWANANTMIAEGGHECINHSHSHSCGVCSSNATCTAGTNGNSSNCNENITYTTTQFATELSLSSAIIEQQTGKKSRFFIHPYDVYTTEIISYLKNNLDYLGSRAGTRSTPNSRNFADPMHLNFYVWGPNGNQNTVSQLNKSVDAAVNSGGYVMREFHDVGYPGGSINNPWGNISVENYTTFLNYVKTKMDAGLIWSATVSEVITYKMQREVYQPSVDFNAQSGLITVSFATNLANLKGVSPTLFTPSVFVTPITLKINISSITGALAPTATQNGVAIPYTRKGNILSMNIYPHNGAVTLNSAVNDPCASVLPPVFINCIPTASFAATAAGNPTITYAIPSAGTATVIKESGIESGTVQEAGTYPIIFKATTADVCAKISRCTLNITVTPYNDLCATDIIKPVFTACPANIVLTTTTTTAIATWTAPTATDNCTATPSVISTHNSGTAFSIGITTVNYTAMDLHNNQETCSFTVTVSQLSNIMDCSSVVVSSINDAINITGLSNTVILQVFKLPAFTVVYNQRTTTPTVTIPALSAGSYKINLQMYKVAANGAWSPLCSKFFDVVVTATALQSSTNNTVLTLDVSIEYERARLDWVSNMNEKTDYFVAQKLTEKSADFKDFETINTSNTLEKLQHYTLYDPTITEGGNFYRIKQVFNDGTILYSASKKVLFTPLGIAEIFPNPTDAVLNIDLKNYKGKNVSIYFYNNIGQPVHVQHFEAVGEKPLEMDVSKLNEGQYLIRIVAQGRRDFIKQVFITR